MKEWIGWIVVMYLTAHLVVKDRTSLRRKRKERSDYGRHK